MWLVGYLMMIAFLVFGVVLVRFGYVGLRQQRPMLIPARMVYGAAVAVFVVVTIYMVTMVIDSWLRSGDVEGILVFAAIAHVVFVGMAIYGWLMQSVGWMMLGVSKGSFRHAIVSALDALDITYREVDDRIELVDFGAILPVAVNIIGIAHLHIESSVSQNPISQIVRELEYLSEQNEIPINKTTFVYGLLSGSLLLLLNSAFIVGWLTIDLWM